MSELRGEEKAVAATVEATLGLAVEQYDDGSQPGMHDLNIVALDCELPNYLTPSDQAKWRGRRTVVQCANSRYPVSAVQTPYRAAGRF